MRCARSKAYFTGRGRFDSCFIQPRQEPARIDAARITEVLWIPAGDFLKAAAIVFNLALEQIPIEWRAMPMRVQLHVRAPFGEFLRFSRRDVMNYALF